MSTFKIHNTDTAPQGSKQILEGAEKSLGFIPNLYGIMSESPSVLKAYNSLSDNFDNSSFTDAEKQIVLLATSYINKCHYCIAVHSTLAQMKKIDKSIVDAIRNNQPITDPKLEVLRKITQAIVEKRGWISEDEIEEFLNADYTKAQLLEIIIGVAQKTLSNYVNHIVKTPLDNAFEPNKWEVRTSS